MQITANGSGSINRDELAYLHQYFLARNYIVEPSCDTEIKLLLCINCGTKNTIPAGSSTLWQRHFVTHREMDKCRSGSFTRHKTLLLNEYNKPKIVNLI